jgi:D-serine deaminase-like pyridoxal phosphate-dependent protein
VQSAKALRDAGFPCPIVSVGSTPTAHFAQDLTGVTEVRAGVFVFHDLVMAGLGVCALDDIAISVLATVIGHQPEKGWILTDAGWMDHVPRPRYRQPTCRPRLRTRLRSPGAALSTQEHGALALREGAIETLPDLPVGALVRLLPNHACATAAQHDRYHLLSEDGKSITAVWPRFGGW